MTKGDLIMFRTLMTEIANKGLTFEEVLLLIDNAPTVDIKDQIAGAYNEGYMCGNKEAEKARPQGFWAEFEGGYRCSNCDDIEVYTPNFCPNCGAKMKGGAE